jgi:tetratricopeptide (TPR) repeat protein
MKHLLICILAIFAVGSVVSAQTPAELWDKANTAYYNDDFVGAVALYDSIDRQGLASAKLYYNMGNAYFRAGRIGKSILYYNKAQKLAPADRDIAYNLEIANTYTRNKIEPIPEFFLHRLMRSLRSTMSANGWATTSLVLFGVALAGLLLFLLPLGRRARKGGFYGGLAALLLLVFALSFAVVDHRESLHSAQGIVTTPSASVKSSPDNAGKDLFLIYEGARVEVRDELNGWCEITIADGNRGWIKASTIEMI